MEAVVTLAEVKAVETRGGAVRYVSTDSDGNEYTTFRQEIGERARELQGAQVRVEYHEQRRGQYTNVYLDRVEPAAAPGEPAAGPPPDGTDPQEAAWQTAVAAAPWLVGEPDAAVPPRELYEKLKPFEERVAEDIAEHRDDPASD
jgi:hypothetical protein